MAPPRAALAAALLAALLPVRPAAGVEPGGEPRGPEAASAGRAVAAAAATAGAGAAASGDRAAGAQARGAARPADPDAEWERAVAAYRSGDFEGSIRALAGLVASLEAAPPAPGIAARWTRAMLRLAQAEATVGRLGEAREAMERVAALDPDARPDPAAFSPSHRGLYEEARRAVAARPRHRLRVTSGEPGGQAWLHGRPLGPVPAEVEVPAGRFRVAVTWGAAGRAEAWVEAAGDPSLPVEVALAPPEGPARPARPPAPEAGPPPRAAAGPPLAAPASARPDLSLDHAAPPPNGWMGPTAIAAGGLAVAGAGVAVWQGLAAADAQAEAQAMVRPDGTLVPGASPSAYQAAVGRYASSRTAAFVAGGVAVGMAAASVVLWVLLDEPPSPGGPAIRF